MLEEWNNRRMEEWNDERIRYRNDGVLEYWNNGKQTKNPNWKKQGVKRIEQRVESVT